MLGDSSNLLMLLARLVPIGFMFAFGACVGSLINVLVYRMPLGLGVVTPPSRCPSCETRLTWRENIPILGWLLLRGRCRFCRSRISPEYPIVELIVGVMFAGVFALWYIVPREAVWLGVQWGAIKPDWSMVGSGWWMTGSTLATTWPLLGVVLTLLGCLVAMTLIDARTYTIPLELTWVPVAAAVLGHTGLALYIQHTDGVLPGMRGTGWEWAIPTTADWWWIGAGIGGVAGLGVSLLLLRAGLIRRSFADYDQWAVSAAQPPGSTPSYTGNDPGVTATATHAPDEASRLAEGPAEGSAKVRSEQGDPEQWIAYPHARREMVRELAYLAPPVLMAIGAGAIANGLWGTDDPDLSGVEGVLASTAHLPPLWLKVLSGVLLGYLIGGGVVWAVRIFGSLAFGKEAMGLGDVHLMAAVGACLGWIDATLAFFLAAFVGVAWAILARIVAGVGGRFVRTLPYGPFLAVATVLVLLSKPLLEVLLTTLTNAPDRIHLP
jgi:leader peptidase (prepilin peptidase)/N-methyltransferase